jgi:hypothetical protein
MDAITRGHASAPGALGHQQHERHDTTPRPARRAPRAERRIHLAGISAALLRRASAAAQERGKLQDARAAAIVCRTALERRVLGVRALGTAIRTRHGKPPNGDAGVRACPAVRPSLSCAKDEQLADGRPDRPRRSAAAWLRQAPGSSLLFFSAEFDANLTTISQRAHLLTARGAHKAETFTTPPRAELGAPASARIRHVHPEQLGAVLGGPSEGVLQRLCVPAHDRPVLVQHHLRPRPAPALSPGTARRRLGWSPRVAGGAAVATFPVSTSRLASAAALCAAARTSSLRSACSRDEPLYNRGRRGRARAGRCARRQTLAGMPAHVYPCRRSFLSSAASSAKRACRPPKSRPPTLSPPPAPSDPSAVRVCCAG